MQRRLGRQARIAQHMLHAARQVDRIGRGKPGVPLAAIVAMQQRVVGEIAYGSERPIVEQRRTGDRKEAQMRPEPRPAVGPVAVAIEQADIDIGRMQLLHVI